MSESGFSLRLIEYDWADFSSFAALEDVSVPSAGVQDFLETFPILSELKNVFW